MGEIFSQEVPNNSIEFTGERLTSDSVGQVQFEHLHRYFFARTFCKGKNVLDVASGEGYGSAYLAHHANSVIGVEISPECVRHAVASYARPNLSYQVGDARRLEFPDAFFDIVVSFETIEHFFEQEQFIDEVRRVLRPDGLFILSTPNRDVYSPLSGPVNEFHLKELNRGELEGILAKRFQVCEFYAQRALIGSALLGDDASVKRYQCATFERRGQTHFEFSQGLARAVYYVVVASNKKRVKGFHSVYIDSNDVDLPLQLLGRAKHAEAQVEAAEAYAGGLNSELESIHSLAARLAAESEVGEAEARGLRAELEATLNQAELLGSEADAAKAEARGLRAELEATLNQAVLLGSEADAAKAEVKDLRAELKSTHNHMVCLAAEAEVAKAASLRSESKATTYRLAEAESLRLELDSLKSAYANYIRNAECERDARDIAFKAVLRSTSWRITRPIRALCDLGRVLTAFVRRGKTLGLAARNTSSVPSKAKLSE